jgi:mannosyl-3-phosphoglycerate phosphatase
MLRRPLVIFTDLDGTLLDHASYSYEPARPALEALEAEGVPVVFCTSKTRAETERWRRDLGNRHPFIVENGGAAIVPAGYFGTGARFDRTENGDGILEFGRPYAELRQSFEFIRDATGLPLRGFGDMTVDEIVKRSGLRRELAELAARREYDEPFTGVDPTLLGAVVLEADASGLRIVSGGRFHHLVGGCDKGRAVRALRGLFERAQPDVLTVGIGDSPNDEPMLREVEIPVLVRRPNGGHANLIHLGGLVIAPYAGPEGWREAVLGILGSLAGGQDRPGLRTGAV